MNKTVYLVCAILVTVADASYAQLNIATRDRIVAADSNYTVAVEASGDVALNTISLAFGLNDGGAGAGGSETAQVVNASLDQTMWDVDPAIGVVNTPALLDVLFTPVLPVGATVADALGATGSSSATATTGSVVLYFDLDLSSKLPGDTVVLNPDFAGFSQALDPTGAAVAIMATSGTLTITRRGDANGDGVVNNLDIGGFILALTNFAGYSAANPGIDGASVLDFSGDGVVNNLDIGGFIAALTGN